ncbi:MAG TPA: hemerythrin domain-containing protein [Allosphingosinicella sp.]|jgi:hemerythrin-like domain-containing protein
MPKARDTADPLRPGETGEGGAAKGPTRAGGQIRVLSGTAKTSAATGIVAAVGGRYGIRFEATTTDWFEALKAEHVSMLDIFDKILSTGIDQTAMRASLVMKLKFILTAHAIQEENVIYPALRQAGSGHADSLDSDHGHMKSHLHQLETMAKDSPEWLPQACDFRAILMEHMRHEEVEVFPAFRQRLSPEENKRLTSLMDRERTKLNLGPASHSRTVFRKLDELPEPQRNRIGNLIEQVRQVLHESDVIEGQGVGPLVELDIGRAAVDRLATDDLSIDWAQSRLLGAPQMAKELGISPATLANWRREGRVVAFKRDLRNYHYPRRQIYRGRVIEGLSDIVRRFDHVEDGWEWLVTPNSRTQGLPPIDRLRLGAREEVERAAEGALDFA